MKLFNIPAIALSLVLTVNPAFAESMLAAELAECNLEVTEELENFHNDVKAHVSRVMIDDPQVATGVVIIGGVDAFSEIVTYNIIQPQENRDDPSLPVNCEILEYNLNQIRSDSFDLIFGWATTE